LVLLIGLGLVLVDVSGGRANGIASLLVTGVNATTEAEQLEVKVMTTSPVAPRFSAFGLREPDRLVMDFPDYVWEPGLTGHLESSHPQVSEVRVGQFSKEPPITRVVFDLRVPANKVQYDTGAGAADGDLSIRVSPTPKQAGPPTQVAPPRRPEPAARPTPTRGPKQGDGAVPAGPVGGTDATPKPGGQAQTPPPDGGKPGPAVTGTETGKKPLAGGTTVQAGQPTVRPPMATPQKTAPVEPPRVERAGALSWRSYVLRALAAIALMVVIAAVAVWLRRRFTEMRSAGSQPVTADISPDQPETQEPIGEPAPPAAESTGAAVRCKIVEGYLVLAPEGGEAALSRLGGHGISRAKVEGSLDLTPVEEETPVEDEAAADEPAVSETPVADDAGADEAAVSETPVAEELVEEESASDASDDDAARVQAIVESLTGENEEARKQAAEGLWGMAREGRADLLASYLESEDPRVRLVVAGVLGEAGAAEFAGPLADIADDPDPSVRATVFYAFSQLGQAASEHLAVVRKGLSDEESSVRARAVEAVAAMAPDDSEVASEVVELTGDPEPLVREAATSAALNFARNGVAEPLAALLGDLTRRAQALELLQQADEGLLKQLLVAARKAPSDSGEAAVATVSYVIGSRCTPADFADDLGSSDPDVRLAALEGLAIVGGEESQTDVDRLSKTDPSPELRQRAAEILTAWEEMAQSTARAGADTSGSDS
jgi:HEAT repeat protein